jgi:hypothetical protein
MNGGTNKPNKINKEVETAAAAAVIEIGTLFTAVSVDMPCLLLYELLLITGILCRTVLDIFQ